MSFSWNRESGEIIVGAQCGHVATQQRDRGARVAAGRVLADRPTCLWDSESNMQSKSQPSEGGTGQGDTDKVVIAAPA